MADDRPFTDAGHRAAGPWAWLRTEWLERDALMAGVALLATLVAAQIAMHALLGLQPAVMLYLIPALLAAVLGGRRAGLMVTGAALVAVGLLEQHARGHLVALTDPRLEFAFRLASLALTGALASLAGGEVHAGHRARRRAWQERLRTERMLGRIEARRSFLLSLQDTLRDPGEEGTAIRRALALLVARVGATGAGLADCDEDGHQVTVRPEQLAGLPALAGRHHAPDFGALPFARLAAGQTVAHADIAASEVLDAAARACYAALGVAAVVQVPEREQGRLERILFVVADAPRHWEEDELRLFEECAARLGAEIRRTRAEGLAEERMRLLRDSRDRMARAEEAARAATWSLDLRTRRFSWPAGTRPIFALPDHAQLHTAEGWRAMVHPDDLERLQQQIRETIQRRDKLDTRFRMRPPDGSLRWLQLRAEVITDEDGEPVQLTGMGIDVTEEESLRARNRELWKTIEERISSEEKLRQASAAKSAFLANMSHEIRTPLAVITGLVERLRHDIQDHGQARRLDQLRDTSEHLLQLINDILDLSKIEADQLELADEPFALADVLIRTHQLLEHEATRKGLTLELDIPSALRAIRLRGDALRLSQVLINLGSNAIKFTTTGRVRLAAEALPQRSGRARLRLSVTDTGCGIDPGLRAQLFDPFVQGDSSAARRAGGTGLGLAICRRIVDRMGGSIEVDSAPGVGSRFSVELALPLAAGSAAADDAAATARAPASSGIEVGPHVLLVEDHPLSQEILTEMLEQLSCEVTIAATGVEALDLAGTSAFDLILMDLQLPGIDGLTATRLIRLLPDYRRTPIVALSANAFREDRARALDAGMNEHVAKPVTAQGLAALLRRWVPQQASGGAAAPAQASPLLGRLAISVADDLTRIRERLAEGDRQQAADIAHGAAGAAALAGAGALAQALMALQRQLGTPQPEAGADEARLGAVALAMDALTEAPARPVA